ncbi:hypothetical protein [uncultured Roseobacter sp.]|uniref:hypothetical protein n=1 Tax=uncultured Roseobacter sp. TaxID=114847 RepID=UPI00261634BB|nr:hypothetical protein [uncultured Roseobacter sp.]
MVRFGLALTAGAVLLSACTAFPGGSNRQVLYGSSFASTDEAVQELNLAVSRTAASHGCSLISVGGGTGLGAGEQRSGGKQIDVYGVIQCPAGTPRFLPNTGVVP